MGWHGMENSERPLLVRRTKAGRLVRALVALANDSSESSLSEAIRPFASRIEWTSDLEELLGILEMNSGLLKIAKAREERQLREKIWDWESDNVRNAAE
jgi:hypothetical protein